MKTKINASRTQKSTNNVIAGVAYRLVMMLFPFLIKTITIYTLGAEYLGLNGLDKCTLHSYNKSVLKVRISERRREHDAPEVHKSIFH